MQGGASFLNAHIVSTAENLAILGHQSCTDRDSTFSGAFLCLLQGGDEASVCFHCDEFQYVDPERHGKQTQYTSLIKRKMDCRQVMYGAVNIRSGF